MLHCILGGLGALISGHCNGILTSWWGATASHVLQNDAGGEGGGMFTAIGDNGGCKSARELRPRDKAIVDTMRSSDVFNLPSLSIKLF